MPSKSAEAGVQEPTKRDKAEFPLKSVLYG
jgi:hypothetical protein